MANFTGGDRYAQPILPAALRYKAEVIQVWLKWQLWPRNSHSMWCPSLTATGTKWAPSRGSTKRTYKCWWNLPYNDRL